MSHLIGSVGQPGFVPVAPESVSEAKVYRPGRITARIGREELMERAQKAVTAIEQLMLGLRIEAGPALGAARPNYTPTDPSHRKVEGVTCPECNDEMRKRTSVWGDFYGCINYPVCQGKRSATGRVPQPRSRRTP